MNNYKLTIAYDGTNYSGWQVQENATSIQQLIQKAIFTIIREKVNLIGSGRTDAGVHAWGQVDHFKTEKNIDIYRLLASLNGLLPMDIRILEIEKVPLSFHAQISAIGKTYHYHLYLDRVQDPFRRLYSYHVRRPCDLELLKQASGLFVGTHDFTSFANEAHAGSASRNPVRTITSINIIPETGGVCLEFTGDGFLYKMVRNIVGTILEVTSGKRPLEDIPIILKGRDRRLAGQAAPPHGLFLMKVYY
jgi:tRNA pseudouridine38-40 synthase